MKVSKYNSIVNLGIDSIIYNTLKRKYIVLNQDELKLSENILNNLDKEYYSNEEVIYIKKLAKIGAIIPKKFDELNYIEFLYNKLKFNNDKFILVLNPTLNCNFRCTYCYENHVSKKFDDDIINKIISLVEEKTKVAKNLDVAWFGGEPLIEFETILNLSNRLMRICKENNCEYQATMTTNGYLLDDIKISSLKSIGLENIQITLDGTEEFHNKKRILKGGDGTFEKVKNNILKLLNNDINVTLRINVDEENYYSIPVLFDSIPSEQRSKVTINLSNIFQNEKKVNLYFLYEEAINKGFKYRGKLNSFIKCEAGTPNSITVYPDGKLSFCSMAAEQDFFYGTLNYSKNNIINIKDKAMYYKFHNNSIFTSEECKKCIELPMCMGNCMLERFKCNEKCTSSGDLSLKEKISLHYLSDLKESEVDSNEKIKVLR